MMGFFFSFRFHGCPIVAVAAKPGGPEAPETVNPLGVSELIEVHAIKKEGHCSILLEVC